MVMMGNDEAVQLESFPVADVAEVETMLRRHELGAYAVYRPSENIPTPSPYFAPLCISFKHDEEDIQHNIIFVNAETQHGWAPFLGWVTIHSEPWKVSDPAVLVQGNQMWPSVAELLEILPELSGERIDPTTGDPMREAGDDPNAAGLGEYANAAAARDAVVSGEVRGGSGGVVPSQLVHSTERPWMGKADDKDLYDLLLWNEHALAMAVAAIASRYGAEQPAMLRLFILHGQTRAWASRLTAREMGTATPLGLLQVESSSMLLWLVSTEVVGCPFLAKALGPAISRICQSRDAMEVDPERTAPSKIPAACTALSSAVRSVLDSLEKHISRFPQACAVILHTIELVVARTFGVMATTTVSRYVFQRFILEAVLAPAAVGATASQPSPQVLRSLSLIHQVLDKASSPEGEFSNTDEAERHLAPLNPIIPHCRAKMANFLRTVLSMGAPHTPVIPESASNGGIEFDPSDMRVLRAFLAERYVEMYSAVVDLRSDAVAAELSARLRPVLFGGINKGPTVEAGRTPNQPHPISMTSMAYQTAIPPPMGMLGAEEREAMQLRENALPAPTKVTDEALGLGNNAAATGLLSQKDATGVGLIFRKDAYGLFHVLTISAGGPADVSGVIEVSDVLVEINGNQVVGMSLAQLKSFITGPIGTPCRLVFERPSGATTHRYEVCLFRGNVRRARATAPPTYAKKPNEDNRVYHEMSKLWSEVEELQQRRARAEKAFHAAEALRQEYELAAAESEQRTQRLRAQLAQVQLNLENVRSHKSAVERQLESHKSAKKESQFASAARTGGEMFSMPSSFNPLDVGSAGAKGLGETTMGENGGSGGPGFFNTLSESAPAPAPVSQNGQTDGQEQPQSCNQQ